MVPEQTDTNDTKTKVSNDATIQAEDERVDGRNDADCEIAKGEESNASSEETTEAEETPDTEQLQQQILDLEIELDTAKEQIKRSLAEAENIRRRSARDVENSRKFALEGFARDLLPAIDNFEVALKSAREHEVEENVVQGIELSVKSLTDAMAKGGITEFDPMGEVFDPEKHMAMTSIEHPDAEPNTVVEVFRKGYLIHNRLLREAEVIVSKEVSTPKD